MCILIYNLQSKCESESELYEYFEMIYNNKNYAQILKICCSATVFHITGHLSVSCSTIIFSKNGAKKLSCLNEVESTCSKEQTNQKPDSPNTAKLRIVC